MLSRGLQDLQDSLDGGLSTHVVTSVSYDPWIADVLANSVLLPYVGACLYNNECPLNEPVCLGFRESLRMHAFHIWRLSRHGHTDRLKSFS